MASIAAGWDAARFDSGLGGSLTRRLGLNQGSQGKWARLESIGKSAFLITKIPCGHEGNLLVDQGFNLGC